MAKEVGLNPRSLIKNIPSPNQRWKLPVKQWIHKLYEGKTGKPPVTKRHNSQTPKRKHAADALVSLQVYTGGPGLTGNSDNSPHPTITDWDEYAGALWDDDDPLGLSEPPCTGRSGAKINAHENGRMTSAWPPDMSDRHAGR